MKCSLPGQVSNAGEICQVQGGPGPMCDVVEERIRPLTLVTATQQALLRKGVWGMLQATSASFSTWCTLEGIQRLDLRTRHFFISQADGNR